MTRVQRDSGPGGLSARAVCWAAIGGLSSLLRLARPASASSLTRLVVSDVQVHTQFTQSHRTQFEPNVLPLQKGPKPVATVSVRDETKLPKSTEENKRKTDARALDPALLEKKGECAGKT